MKHCAKYAGTATWLVCQLCGKKMSYLEYLYGECK